MSKPSYEVIQKYKKKTYKNYGFALRNEDELNDKLKEYKKHGAVSVLITTLLREYFELNPVIEEEKDGPKTP